MRTIILTVGSIIAEQMGPLSVIQYVILSALGLVAILGDILASGYIDFMMKHRKNAD